MTAFRLDTRLERDCHVLGRLGGSRLLLMDNAAVPWFILVPATRVTELYQLTEEEQADLLRSVNLLSRFVRDNFPVSKLNVAAIGNIVSQLHVHVIGRDPADHYWPGVVWGAPVTQRYDPSRIAAIADLLKSRLTEQGFLCD